MPTYRPTRRDPMKEVMPYELLKKAHDLMVAKQNLDYWTACPEPKFPRGRVRYEKTRQVATFAVPLLGLVLTAVVDGLGMAILGLPVAWLVGFLLDRQLMSAIYKKRISDCNVDAGRYEAVKFLSEKMGIPRSEVTLEVIYKMAADFRVEDSKPERVKARAEAAARVEAVRRVGSSRFGRRYSGDIAYYGTAATADDGVTGAPGVNPASGLPMLGGGVFDTAGSPFGFDNTAT